MADNLNSIKLNTVNLESSSIILSNKDTNTIKLNSNESSSNDSKIPGIELLMNDKKKSKQNSQDDSNKNLLTLEAELNNLSSNTSGE